jgi:hypothetical protein
MAEMFGFDHQSVSPNQKQGERVLVVSKSKDRRKKPNLYALFPLQYSNLYVLFLHQKGKLHVSLFGPLSLLAFRNIRNHDSRRTFIWLTERNV